MMPIDQCDECDAYEGDHRIGCSQFTGKIDARGLARFLFDHSNASNDGARVMEMMDSMARGLARAFGSVEKGWVLADD